MSNQPKLIDADKLLKTLDEIAEKVESIDMQEIVKAIAVEIRNGLFDPDPIPLPSIYPGNKVRHIDRKMKYLGIGNVLEISASGERARVDWPNYDKSKCLLPPYPAYYRLDKLEVIE